jgi:V8-like Glu-specific endopeptidase
MAVVEPREAGSICGTTTDWQPVEQYNGTLGATVAFVNAHQAPVGQMFPIGCTGSLVAEDLFLTAGHCVDAETPGRDQVRFNYQDDSIGNPRTTDVYDILAVEEDGTGGLDFAIVRLDTNAAGSHAGNVWGFGVPSGFGLEANGALTIIQHPNAIPKVIDAGTFSGTDSDGYATYGDIDTNPGSSGSSVWQNDTGYIVAVHTNGGCTRTGGSNRGVLVLDILQQSDIIAQLAIDPAKLVAAVSVLM